MWQWTRLCELWRLWNHKLDARGINSTPVPAAATATLTPDRIPLSGLRGQRAKRVNCLHEDS